MTIREAISSTTWRLRFVVPPRDPFGPGGVIADFEVLENKALSTPQGIIAPGTAPTRAHHPAHPDEFKVRYHGDEFTLTLDPQNTVFYFVKASHAKLNAVYQNAESVIYDPFLQAVRITLRFDAGGNPVANGKKATLLFWYRGLNGYGRHTMGVRKLFDIEKQRSNEAIIHGPPAVMPSHGGAWHADDVGN